MMNNTVNNEKKTIMIAEYWSRLGEEGLAYESERLYRTKNDNYLLYVCTGPLCAETRGIKSKNISQKVRLSKGQAYKWLKAHNEKDVVKEFFYDKLN